MGEIADTLRATLRQLAQSDARLYRGFEEEFRRATPPSAPSPLVEADPPASREDLESLSIAALWSLCKARGIKGLSKGPVHRQVEALLHHPDGPPLRGTLPTKAVRGGRSMAERHPPSPESPAELQVLAQRLDRLEELMVLIARKVGVSPKALTKLFPGSSLPPL